MSIELLLEGFTDATHPRGWHGRWIAAPGGHTLSVFHGDAHVTDVHIAAGTDAASNRTIQEIKTSRQIGEAGRTISTQDLRRLVDTAKGSGPVMPTAKPARASADSLHRALATATSRGDTVMMDSLKKQLARQGGVAMPATAARQAQIAGADRLAMARRDDARASQVAAAQNLDRHGGFKIGDVVRYATGSRTQGGHGPVVMTPQPGLHTVVGLQRNGNLRVKHPGNGTTVDVHHSDATKISPLHPDYRGKVVQDAYAAQKAVLAAEKAARARGAGLAESVLGSLLEGFAPDTSPPAQWHGKFVAGDRVRVTGKSHESVVGRVVRPHDAKPDSHVVIAPEGGGAHVMAEIGSVRLDTPGQHAAATARAQRDAMAAGGPPGAPQPGKPGAPAPGKPAAKPGTPAVREGLELLLEAFGPPPAPAGAAAPPTSVAQSNAQGATQVAAAQAAVKAGWTTAKHPRGQGGKFAYTTGGKRATTGPHHSRSTSSSSSKSKGGTATGPRTLGIGSNGALVHSIQRQLGLPPGAYGPRTKAAVMRFQQQHGLQVDGVVGRQTLAALRGNPNAKSIAPGPISGKQAALRAPRKPSAAKRKATAAKSRYGGGVII